MGTADPPRAIHIVIKEALLGIDRNEYASGIVGAVGNVAVRKLCGDQYFVFGESRDIVTVICIPGADLVGIYIFFECYIVSADYLRMRLTYISYVPGLICEARDVFLAFGISDDEAEFAAVVVDVSSDLGIYKGGARKVHYIYVECQTRLVLAVAGDRRDLGSFLVIYALLILKAPVAARDIEPVAHILPDVVAEPAVVLRDRGVHIDVGISVKDDIGFKVGCEGMFVIDQQEVLRVSDVLRRGHEIFKGNLPEVRLSLRADPEHTGLIKTQYRECDQYNRPWGAKGDHLTFFR